MKLPESQGICEEYNFTKFFRAHISGLRNYLFFKFGDGALADDLAQEAFVKLWQNCAEVRYPKSFVYTVAKNSALNHASSQKTIQKYADRLPSETTDYASPEFLMEEEEFQKKFDRAISELTEAQRTALLLNRIEGKKYREIAEMLGISVKAVEKRIHGAMVAMKEKIEHFR